jgi:hypothetical protein
VPFNNGPRWGMLNVEGVLQPGDMGFPFGSHT